MGTRRLVATMVARQSVEWASVLDTTLRHTAELKCRVAVAKHVMAKEKKLRGMAREMYRVPNDTTMEYLDKLRASVKLEEAVKEERRYSRRLSQSKCRDWAMQWKPSVTRVPVVIARWLSLWNGLSGAASATYAKRYGALNLLVLQPMAAVQPQLSPQWAWRNGCDCSSLPLQKGAKSPKGFLPICLVYPRRLETRVPSARRSCARSCFRSSAAVMYLADGKAMKDAEVPATCLTLYLTSRSGGSG